MDAWEGSPRAQADTPPRAGQAVVLSFLCVDVLQGQPLLGGSGGYEGYLQQEITEARTCVPVCM